MSLSEFLARILGILDAAETPYMLTGSLAASFHGAPRATQDVDLVIETDRASVARLTSAFDSAGLYVSPEAALEAIRLQGQFNVIDSGTGWKADLVIRKDRPFSREEFGRRQPVKLLDRQVFIVSAEDLIIAKLEWAKKGQSERQLKDVAGIVKLQGDELDRAYLARWIEALELSDLWTQVGAILGIGRSEGPV